MTRRQKVTENEEENTTYEEPLIEVDIKVKENK